MHTENSSIIHQQLLSLHNWCVYNKYCDSLETCKTYFKQRLWDWSGRLDRPILAICKPLPLAPVIVSEDWYCSHL